MTKEDDISHCSGQAPDTQKNKFYMNVLPVVGDERGPRLKIKNQTPSGVESFLGPFILAQALPYPFSLTFVYNARDFFTFPVFNKARRIIL